MPLAGVVHISFILYCRRALHMLAKKTSKTRSLCRRQL